MLIGNFVVAKATPRTVTPPTARVPPTAAAKQGLNKGSTENNHNNSVLNAQVDDLSNQVKLSSRDELTKDGTFYLNCFASVSFSTGDRFEAEFGGTRKGA